MERKLIDFNEAVYNSQIGAFDTFTRLIENVIDIFNSFKIGEFKREDLEDLILDTQNYIDKKLLQSKDLSLLLEMGFNKAKVIEMLKRPENEDELFSKVEQLKKLFKIYNDTAHLGIQNIKHLFQHYSFDGTNKLVLKQEYSDRFRKFQEVYIETNEAKTFFSFATDLINLFEKYKIKVCSNADYGNLMQRLLKIENDKPVINIPHIQDIERRSHKS